MTSDGDRYQPKLPGKRYRVAEQGREANMSVPNTFSIRPAQFWKEGDETKVEVVRTQVHDAKHSNSDVWRLTPAELVALVDAITASSAWQDAVNGGDMPPLAE